MFVQPISIVPPKRMIELTISKSESRREGRNAGWTSSDFPKCFNMIDVNTVEFVPTLLLHFNF